MEAWEEGERGPGEREGWRLATPGGGGTCPCPGPMYHLVEGFSLEVDELVAEGRKSGRREGERRGRGTVQGGRKKEENKRERGERKTKGLRREEGVHTVRERRKEDRV